MAISEFEERRCRRELDKFLGDRRPPPSLRDQVDLGYRIQNQSVEIFELRPRWDDPSQKFESPIAKATYVKSQKNWKIYWQKSDMKWHSYSPCSEVKLLEEFLQVVIEDEHCCFFG